MEDSIKVYCEDCISHFYVFGCLSSEVTHRCTHDRWRVRTYIEGTPIHKPHTIYSPGKIDCLKINKDNDCELFERKSVIVKNNTIKNIFFNNTINLDKGD